MRLGEGREVPDSVAMASAAKRPRSANSSQIVLVQDEDHASDEEIELDQELEKENEFSG